jgi:hypothetical protein
MLYCAYYVYFLHHQLQGNMFLISDYWIHGNQLPTIESDIVVEQHDSFQTKYFDSKYQKLCGELQENLKKSISKYQGEEGKSCLVRYLKIRLLDNKGNMIIIPTSIDVEGESINLFPGEPVSFDVENATATIDFCSPINVTGINLADSLTIDSTFPNYSCIIKDFRNLYKLATLIERCSVYKTHSIVADKADFNPLRAHFTDFLNGVVKGTKFESSAQSLVNSMILVSEDDCSNLITPKNIAAYILAEEIIQNDYGLDFYDLYPSTNEFAREIEQNFDEIGNTDNLIEFLEGMISNKSFDMEAGSQWHSSF